MKIHNSLHQTWLSQYEHGDYIGIARAKNISVVTVRNAIETGHCSRSTMEKINDYFIEKNKSPEEIINKITQA